MTESLSKKQFPYYEQVVFNEIFSEEFKVSYLAITKGSHEIDDDKKFIADDDYSIEIGFIHKKPINIDSVKKENAALDFFFESVIKEVNKILPKNIIDVNEPPIPKEVQPAKLHDNCPINKKPYKIKLSKPNGGCSTANNRLKDISGTIGLAFELKKRKSIYFLSNFHVLAGYKSMLYETILHPSRNDTESVGPNEDYNPIGTLFWYNISDYTDAAICQLNSTNQVSGGIRSDSTFKIKDIIKPRIGMEIVKCGRSSGLTKGVIRSTFCSVLIEDYRISKKGRRIFKDQILTNCISVPGDSGSVLLSKEGSPIGLLFAGDEETSTYHNKLTQIFNTEAFFCNNIKMPEIELKNFI